MRCRNCSTVIRKRAKVYGVIYNDVYAGSGALSNCGPKMLTNENPLFGPE